MISLKCTCSAVFLGKSFNVSSMFKTAVLCYHDNSLKDFRLSDMSTGTNSALPVRLYGNYGNAAMSSPVCTAVTFHSFSLAVVKAT